MFDPLAGAEQDVLTGFYRREALEFFSKLVAMDTNSSKKKYGVAIIDLDHFKHFNDKYGHQFGDEILKHAASILRNTVSGNGHIFRYGGDEFVIIYPDFTPQETFQITQACNRNIVVNPFMHKGKAFFLTFSCGVASFSQDGNTIEAVLKKADDALYYAKKKGRNRVILFSRMKYFGFGRILKLVITLGLAVFLGLMIRDHIPKDLPELIKGKLAQLRIMDAVFESAPNQDIKKPVVQEPVIEVTEVVTPKAVPQKIKAVVEESQETKPKPKLKTYAEVRLKQGGMVLGTIIEETESKIVVRLDLDDGKGRISVLKSDIDTINYVTYSSEGS